MSASTPTVETAPHRSFCEGYKPAASVCDEMIDASGALRPHWHMFVNLLDDLGWAELRRRWDQAKRLIHDNGVTYNVYGDPQGMDRPWNLDAIPLLLSPQQWEPVERGLKQRAELLNLLLADLYGPQKLLHEGLLPLSLVFAHPNFLRPCHGIKPPGGRWLHIYAADLGQSADGRMWVISDRTQAPSGAGYALENRTVLSRALPDVFRDCNVNRLALFFRTMQKTLAGLATHNRDNPRIVLLTPGPYNETYFEHAYLARYLGYTLVEGGDLIVRDQRVYLKTLGGLQTVDVILRRLDDDFCDPLELRLDSTLGIPGLVEAVHNGNVALANPLGSGAAEAPAIEAFLPGLCRRLMGQDLMLPSVPTWWCGESRALEHAIANLSRMVIKPAFPRGEREPVFGSELSQAQREEQIARLRANPQNFVAQEQLPLATAPVLVNTRLEPRHIVLRAHLVSDADSYTVMPGGLARFSASTESRVVSMQKGGGSKDTWLLAGGPVDTFTLLQPESKPVALSRGGGDLPSRVADNLFWLGKYVERAEGMARLVRGILVRVADQATPENIAALQGLYSALSGIQRPAMMKLDDADGAPMIPESQVLALIFDEAQRGSLKGVLADAHRLARNVRDRISIDTWNIVSKLDEEFQRPHQKPHANQLTETSAVLDKLVITLAAFGGLVMDSMTRGQAWRFLDMGRRTERAQHTLKLLRGTLVNAVPRERALLEAVLEVADSAMTYRRRYMTSLQLHAVLDLLVADETNPRSVGFQLAALDEHAEHLPKSTAAGTLRSPEQQILLRTLTGVRLVDIRAESEIVERGVRVKLNEFLGVLGDHLLLLSDSIAQSYFSHATVSRQTTVRATDTGE